MIAYLDRPGQSHDPQSWGTVYESEAHTYEALPVPGRSRLPTAQYTFLTQEPVVQPYLYEQEETN